MHSPVMTSKLQRCHGHVTSLPMRSPSASGPPRCGQVLSVANQPSFVWYTAIVRPFTTHAFMRPTGSVEVLATSNSVAEGYPTARSAYQLARRLEVETPLIDEVYAFLYEGKNLKDSLRDLTTRSSKAED